MTPYFIMAGGLATGAMDYERMCAQLAEKHQHGMKTKKKKSKKDGALGVVINDRGTLVLIAQA